MDEINVANWKILSNGLEHVTLGVLLLVVRL